LAEIARCKGRLLRVPVIAVVKTADAGGPLAFGSDSHTAFTLGRFDHCLRIAREVDFPEDRVLNVTPRRLLDFLELRSGKHIAELADF